MMTMMNLMDLQQRLARTPRHLPRLNSAAHLAAVTITLAACLAAGCVKDKSKRTAPEEIKTIDAAPLETKTPAGQALDVRVEFRSDGMLLHIGNIPAGATVECRLDDKPLAPCHDGALFARPATGDHRIFVAAFKDKLQVNAGQSESFTLTATSETVNEANTNGLRLVIDDASITNDAAVPMNKDLLVRFKFEGTPACAAKVQCQTGPKNSLFWHDCADDGKSYLVRSSAMALGKQYFAVQAKCGDQIGPALQVQWYGVPANYQPLQLQSSGDAAKGRYLVDLVRDIDCAEGEARHYECAEKADSAFTRCTDGNSVITTVKGYRIRLICGDKTGPELTLGQ